MQETVNLPGFALRWFESSPAHEYKNELKLLLGRFLFVRQAVKHLHASRWIRTTGALAFLWSDTLSKN